MDNTGQLINYIVQELKRGVPETGIRSALLQNGWPVGPVDRAFSILRQNEPLPASAVELPDINTAKTPEQPATLPAARDLPGDSQPPRGRQRRSVVGIILVLVLVTLAGFGIVSFFTKEEPAKKNTPVASSDEQRRTALDGLGDDLTGYYKKHGTYPLLSEMNTPGFAKANGFTAAGYQDPSWKNDNTACKNEKGDAVLLETRAEGCYGYRVTARNGGACDAAQQKCTRVVLTATLDNGKPYIYALDRNKQEKH